MKFLALMFLNWNRFLFISDVCRNPRLQRLQAEDDDSCPVILDRDFHSLHRNVPALRRRDVDTTAIRQHYYPEGGWGWIICGAGFIVHLFTTGLQLSFGLLYLHTLHHIGNHALMDTGECIHLGCNCHKIIFYILSVSCVIWTIHAQKRKSPLFF